MSFRLIGRKPYSSRLFAARVPTPASLIAAAAQPPVTSSMLVIIGASLTG
jgi:hypothetical protein